MAAKDSCASEAVTERALDATVPQQQNPVSFQAYGNFVPPTTLSEREGSKAKLTLTMTKKKKKLFEE